MFRRSEAKKILLEKAAKTINRMATKFRTLAKRTSTNLAVILL